MDVSGLHINLPNWAQGVVGWSIVIGAISAILAVIRNLLNSSLLKVVVKELTNNGGASLKDKVEESLRQNEAIIREQTDARIVMENFRRDHDAIKKEVAQVKQEVNFKYDALSKKFDRFVVHEARNDLGTSLLFKESEQAMNESSGDNQ